MGMRLTLYVLPKNVAKKLWNAKDYDEYYNITNNLEQIVHDFCTDAMFDVGKHMKRATKSKLDIECDIRMGKMDKKLFEVFMDRIKWYAERQIKESPDPVGYWPYIRESDNNWRLCYTIDWIGAYFESWYIHKKMDWNKNFIYFVIS